MKNDIVGYTGYALNTTVGIEEMAKAVGMPVEMYRAEVEHGMYSPEAAAARHAFYESHGGFCGKCGWPLGAPGGHRCPKENYGKVEA
jgi:hypothetical protein